ncbi:DUF7467 domain-containing protein [Ferrimonas kyonanensis]|uniref:DUF7467 domain-containing protein n=1 Tax=Ferrimonas kyonanensis TaxID=364763 RepID=UPI0012EBDA00|nr:hypothetical protein [Ferrimonas kyonanensis]
MNSTLYRLSKGSISALLLSSTLLLSPSSFSEGNEMLGDVANTAGNQMLIEALQRGSKIRIAGTGLHSLPETPGSISITVNSGETIERVLLYWQVFDEDTGYDLDIDVERVGSGAPTMVTGEVIGEYVEGFGGSPSISFYNAYSATIRADITALNLVQPGSNTLLISGLDDIALPNPDFGDDGKNGAGIMLIYSDSSSNALQLKDGHDAAWWERNYPGTDKFSETLGSTVPVRFEFAPSGSERFANLSMFVASVEGDGQTGNDRPSVVVIRVGDNPANEIRDADALMSNQGDEWDDYIRNVPIPAGVDFIEIEILSETDPYVDPLAVLNPDGSKTIDPASFVWVAAGLSTPQEQQNACECRPKQLTFTYVGGSCAASDNDQGDDFKCTGDLNNVDNINVATFQHKFRLDQPQRDILVLTPSVAKGGNLVVVANGTGGRAGRLPAQTKLLLTADGLQQTLDLHTSCSVPLNTGDQFGPLVLQSFVSRDNCSND